MKIDLGLKITRYVIEPVYLVKLKRSISAVFRGASSLSDEFETVRELPNPPTISPDCLKQ